MRISAARRVAGLRDHGAQVSSLTPQVPTLNPQGPYTVGTWRVRVSCTKVLLRFMPRVNSRFGAKAQSVFR